MSFISDLWEVLTYGLGGNYSDVAATDGGRPPNGLLFGRRPQVQPVYNHALLMAPDAAGAFMRGLQRTRQAVERTVRT